MTLFIACLLIYHFGMGWEWYAIAAFVWFWHLVGFAYLNEAKQKGVRGLFFEGQ